MIIEKNRHLGIKVGMMPTPNDKFVDLKPLLRNKLKGE